MDRNELIRRLYYQELGRLDPDEEGLNYWAGQTDLDETQLRNAMRQAAGLEGESVTAPLLADQSYAAFLRKMQFDESQIQSSLQAAQEAARRRIEAQAGMFDQQRKQGARGIDRSFEARQNRSGARLSRLAEQRAGIDRQQTQFNDGIHEGNAKMERDAASRIADLRRERAEQEIGARDRITQRSVEY